jgi:L-malate glycosyltransferase
MLRLKIKKTREKKSPKNIVKPKILLISNMYPSKKQLFFGVFVKNIANLLSKNGFTILLAVKNGNSDNLIIKSLQYFKFFLVSILKGLFLKYNIIYVHYIAHSAVPVLIIRFFRKRIRIVSHTHGGDILEELEIFKAITYKTLNISNIIITPSSYFKGVLINKYRIKPQKIKISPSGGVDTNLFKPGKVNRKKILKNYANQIVLGFVSRIDKGKGWQVFLQAIKKLKEETKIPVLGIIIGNGKEVNSMQKLIKELQLTNNINYLGAKKHECLPFFYNCFDLFIFPTERKAESLGLVGLEAMSCGIPVIGSQIGGLTTYIKNRINGYTFSPGSVENLCKKTTKYLHLNEKSRKKMKQSARETALKYERNKVAYNLSNFFKELCHQ